VDFLYVQVLSRITEGVTEVWFPKKRGSGTKRHSLNPSLQYAIVEYASHRSAAMARRRLIPDRVELWGRQIIVDWATPEICRKVSFSLPITKPQIVFYEIQEHMAFTGVFKLLRFDRAS
jgi:hypothetical protein